MSFTHLRFLTASRQTRQGILPPSSPTVIHHECCILFQAQKGRSQPMLFSSKRRSHHHNLSSPFSLPYRKSFLKFIQKEEACQCGDHTFSFIVTSNHSISETGAGIIPTPIYSTQASIFSLSFRFLPDNLPFIPSCYQLLLDYIEFRLCQSIDHNLPDFGSRQCPFSESDLRS